jgi:tryptophan synthase beta chain
MGIFYPFIRYNEVGLIGVEAGGRGIKAGMHAARFAGGSVGVFQGAKSYLLQDVNGQVLKTYSISAGLDYASVGPEHSLLKEAGRVRYVYATDDEVLEAFYLLSKEEGIIPALESSHALAYVMKHPSEFKGRLVLINLSGRGDKDLSQVIEFAKEGHG